MRYGRNKFQYNCRRNGKSGPANWYKTSRINPENDAFFEWIENSVHIIDLEKSAEKLKEALKFIQKIISEDKNLLIVGTKIQAKGLVKNISRRNGIALRK